MADYNIIKYQVGVQGERNWSKSLDLAPSINLIAKMAAKLGPPYRVSDDGHDFGPKRTLPEAKNILTTRMEASKVGDKYFLSAADAKKVFVIRKVETNLKLINTVGTNQIDLIYSAVTEKFAGLVNWGICNCRSISGTSTWSQHAWCHAWDIHGTSNQMKAVFDFLVEEGRSGRLPVAHAIYDYRIWSPSEGIHGYGGTNPHTDHLHVDASPNFTGRPPCAN